MARNLTVAFTPAEASVTLDALVHLSAMTKQEMRDQMDWDARKLDAWCRALRKVDDALSLRAAA